MEEKEIIEILKEQHFDDFTIELLLIAIRDFDKLYGRYMPIQKVVNRVCKNLDKSVEVRDLGKGKYNTDLAGTYNSRINVISLDESIQDDRDTLEEVFFHEFIHCLTNIEFELYDEKLTTVGFSFLSDGLDEGMTDLLTLKRSTELYGKKGNRCGYPILSQEMKNLLSIIPQDEAIECFFYKPYAIDYLIEKYGMNFSEIFYAFDSIREKEKIILQKSFKTRKKPLFRLFGSSISKRNKDYHETTELTYQYIKGVGKAESLKDLKRKLEFFKKLQKQGKDNTYLFNEAIITDIIYLREKGLDEGEINSIVEEKWDIEFLEIHKEIKDALKKDKTEGIKIVSDIIWGSDDFPEEIIDNPNIGYFDLLNNHFFGRK